MMGKTDVAGPPGFEPGLQAPQACVLSRLDHGPSPPLSPGGIKEVRESLDVGGIGEVLRAFRGMVEELGKGKKVLFLGAEGTCLPFAELLAHACRDLVDSFYFCPGIRVEETVELKPRPGYGFQTGERAWPGKVGMVVVMGGLALPGSGVRVEEVRNLLPSLLEEGGGVIGFGFSGVLGKGGWEKLNYRGVLDVYLGRVKVR
jgi:hypothetical protein